MFVEINKELLKKSDSELEKRWFRDADHNCDLFIWQNGDQKVVRFQFWIEESLLEWSQNKGFKTGRLDQQSGAFTSYQAPLFRYHSNFDRDILNSIQGLIAGEKDFIDSTDVFDRIYKQLEEINLGSNT